MGASSSGRIASYRTGSGYADPHCVDRYFGHLAGDVKKLKPPFTGFRLRCGDYRVLFDHAGENTIDITSVRHRRDAYR